MLVRINVIYGAGAGRSWCGDIEEAPASVLSPGDESSVENARAFAMMMLADQRDADITGIHGTVSVMRVRV